ESYLKSQQEYFSIIERFVGSQIMVTEILIADATSKINNIYKEKALRGIDPKDKQKTQKALDELADRILQEQKSDQEGITKVKGYYLQLKELHQDMLKSLGTILLAQKKLNEYIQLQKADEVAASQLLSIVGVEKDKVDRAATTAA